MTIYGVHKLRILLSHQFVLLDILRNDKKLLLLSLSLNFNPINKMNTIYYKNNLKIMNLTKGAAINHYYEK